MSKDAESVLGDQQFFLGFASAILSVTGLALLTQGYYWFASAQQPEALLAFLQTPRFSLLDVFGVLILLLTAALVLGFMVRGPRL